MDCAPFTTDKKQSEIACNLFEIEALVLEFA